MPTSKILLTGPAGSGKTHQVLEAFVRSLREAQDPLAEDFFLILPSAEHVDRMTTLALQHGLEGFFHSRITTLTDLVRKVFAVPDERVASSALRYLLVRDLLGEESLGYFSELQAIPGFHDLILHFVTELKESRLAPEDLRRGMNRLKRLEPELSEKYEALARLYERYEERLRAEGFVDRQDLFKIFERRKEERLAARKRFKKIWLDGFFDFTPLQQEYLRALTELSEETVMTLTLEEGLAREDLFACVLETEQRLLAMGFEKRPFKPENFRSRTAGLTALERGLFASRKPPQAPVLQEEIKILEAVGMQGEVEMIAGEIKRRMERKPELRLSDFAVLLRHVGPYEGVLRSVFADYGIPVEIHERQRLKLSPWVQTVAAFLKVFLDGWQRGNLFNFLKSNYVRRLGPEPKSFHEVALLEAAALRGRVFQGRESWLALETPAAFPGSGETLRKLREKLLAPLAAFQDRFESASGCEALETVLAEAADFFGWRDPEESAPEILRREAEALRRLDATLEEVRLHFLLRGKTAVRFPEFAADWLKLIDMDLYSLHERDPNRIQVYDVSLARQKEYRVVFVAGLLERQFPVLIREDPLLSDWERELWNASSERKLGLRLERQSLERYLFYLAVTRAREALILSYPKMDREGKESLPSFYAGEVQAVFGGRIPVQKQDLARPYPRLEEAAHERGLELALAGRLWHEDAWRESETLLLANRFLERPGKSRLFESAWVSDAPAKIRDPRILETPFFRLPKTSASRLETYAACPFQYFAKEILRLKDPAEDTNARNQGTAMHRVLELFFPAWIRGGKALRSPEALGEFIDRELAPALKEAPFFYEKNYQNELAREETRDRLFRFLSEELKRLADAKLQPRYFEFSFGTGKKPDAPAIAFELGAGESVLITGKIDRMDTDGSETFGLVIDYKRSAKFRPEDLAIGTALQLPIYLKAMALFLKLRPVGGELYSIADGTLKGFYHAPYAEGLKTLAPRAMKLAAQDFEGLLAQSDAWIRHFVGGIRGGGIEVRPRECGDYCPYSGVCRIEKWRREEILEEILEEDRKRGDGKKQGKAP